VSSIQFFFQKARLRGFGSESRWMRYTHAATPMVARRSHTYLVLYRGRPRTPTHASTYDLDRSVARDKYFITLPRRSVMVISPTFTSPLYVPNTQVAQQQAYEYTSFGKLGALCLNKGKSQHIDPCFKIGRSSRTFAIKTEWYNKFS
jgi:hypothetical protein